MADGRKTSVTFTPTPQVKQLLDDMVEDGLFGTTRSEVVRRIVDRYMAENYIPLVRGIEKRR